MNISCQDRRKLETDIGEPPTRLLAINKSGTNNRDKLGEMKGPKI